MEVLIIYRVFDLCGINADAVSSARFDLYRRACRQAPPSCPNHHVLLTIQNDKGKRANGSQIN